MSDAAETRQERFAARGAVALAVLVAFVLLGLPLLLPYSLAWALLLLPVILLSNSYWAVVHEAVHGNLLATREANDRLGRLLAILFGSAFALLRTAHLGHHRFNRHTFDRPDSFDPSRTGRIAAYGRYYWGLAFGLYLGEIAGPLVCLLPRDRVARLIDRAFLPAEPGVAAHAKRLLLTPASLREVRIDGVLALALLGLAFWLYGPYWPLLLGFLILRGFLVGFVDNLYHHGTPLDDRRFAWNLALPHWASRLILHGNFHRLHHQQPNLPWHQLPVAMAKARDRFDESFWRASGRQMLGPIEVGRLPHGAGRNPSL